VVRGVLGTSDVWEGALGAVAGESSVQMRAVHVRTLDAGVMCVEGTS